MRRDRIINQLISFGILVTAFLCTFAGKTLLAMVTWLAVHIAALAVGVVMVFFAVWGLKKMLGSRKAAQLTPPKERPNYHDLSRMTPGEVDARIATIIRQVMGSRKYHEVNRTKIGQMLSVTLAVEERRVVLSFRVPLPGERAAVPTKVEVKEEVSHLTPSEYDISSVPQDEQEEVVLAVLSQVAGGKPFEELSRSQHADTLTLRIRVEDTDRLVSFRMPQSLPNEPMPELHVVHGIPEPRPTSLNLGRAEVEEALRGLDWYQFEKVIKLVLQLADPSCRITKEGGGGGDGGVDLWMETGGKTAVVQCKHWRTWSVNPAVIRELVGTIQIEGADRGICITLMGFSEKAYEAARGQRIDLWTSETIYGMILGLNQEDKDEVFEFLLNPPKCCPHCDAPLHTAKDGKQKCSFCREWFDFPKVPEPKKPKKRTFWRRRRF